MLITSHTGGLISFTPAPKHPAWTCPHTRFLGYTPASQVKPHLHVDYDDMTYFPTVWFNEFWLLRDKMVPLNGSVAEVPLQLSVYPLSLWKFTIYLQMDQSFSMQARPSGLPCSRH